MKKIFLFSLITMILFACDKDDTSIPTVEFSTKADDFLVELGQPFDVTYTLDDDIGVTNHSIQIVDGDNSIIQTYEETGDNGTYTRTILIEDNVTGPIIFKVQAEDEVGNIGSSALEFEMQGLDIKFNLLYDGEPVEYFKIYNYPTESGENNGDSILFSKVSFFMSDLKLDDNLTKEIDYLRIEKTATDTAVAEVLIYQGLNIASGNYSKLSFDIGVPPELNAMVPADFPSSSPLSKASEYWNNWSSYIFAKIEGNIDLDPEETGLEQGIALHLGFQDAYMKFEFDKDIVIGGNTRALVEIDIELIDIFKQGSSIYDIEAVPSTHSAEELPQIIELKNNFEKSLTIK